MQKAHVDSEGGFPGDGTLRYETLSSSRCECDAVIGLCELVYNMSVRISPQVPYNSLVSYSPLL